MINPNILQVRDTDVSKYTYSEKKRALAKLDMVHPKTFADQWTQENVDTLVEILRNDVLLASKMYAELTKATTAKRTNIFDGPSLITVNSYGYSVGPEKITEISSTADGISTKSYDFKAGFFTTDPQVAPNPMGIAVRILGNAISTRGEEVKAKPVSTLVKSAIPPPIANLGREFIKFKGTETDAMQMTFSALAAGPIQNVRTLVDAIAPHVPTHVQTVDNKTVALPLVSFYGGKEAKFSGEYKELARPMMPFITTMDTASTALTKKGQGKFTKDAYLGVPMSSNDLFEHKVTLDDAHFSIGQTLLVVSASSTLVQFLRANYGPTVVGIGNTYPMLTKDELAGTKFDAIYFPVPLKVPTTGTPEKMLEAAKSAMKNLNLDVSGNIISYISPFFVMSRPFEKKFFRSSSNQSIMYLAKPDDSIDTEITDHKIDKKGVEYTAHKSPQNSTSHWLPYQLAEIETVQREYVLKMLELDSDPYLEQFKQKKGNFSPTEFAILWDRFQFTPQYPVYVKERQQILFTKSASFISSQFSWDQNFKENYYTTVAQRSVVTRCAVSIGSRKGLLLYSGLLPEVTVSSVLNLLMVFVQHCCRSVWHIYPFTLNTYHVNKIHARPKRIDMSCMESFTSVYAASILSEIQEGGGHIEQEVIPNDDDDKNDAISRQMEAAKKLIAETEQF
jgi:hypothetical protein